MEYIICNRRQSICCQEDKIFRKYFKYADKQIVEHEAKYSRLYEALRINTPHFIKTGFSKRYGLFFNDYYYIDMTPLNEADIDKNIFQQISVNMNKIAGAKILHSDGIKFWEQRYRADLIYALSFLKNINTDILLQKVYEQKISVIMHGDFSIFNMGLSDNIIYTYDFASSGCAPLWWDWGYFIASLSQNSGRKIYDSLRSENEYKYKSTNDDLLHCVQLASAVKFGRALRKHEDIEQRCNIFKYWSEVS